MFFCYLHINICRELIPIYLYTYKLTTVVEGGQKAPFSIATTLSCRGGRYSFSWIAPLYP